MTARISVFSRAIVAAACVFALSSPVVKALKAFQTANGLQQSNALDCETAGKLSPCMGQLK
jgi:hypothetical protein